MPELRKDPESWKYEVVTAQLFAPQCCPLIDKNIDQLIQEYSIVIKSYGKKQLLAEMPIFIEWMAENIYRFTNDLYKLVRNNQ